MHYPFWFVPGLTAPMLIAVIAVLHVFVSLYAVGGGIFLARETAFAYRTSNREYLAYLRGHAWFFILITVVYGAITGVGIWWTIGLASPLPTEMLIHAFVFAWAMEYAFFILEIVSAFIFYYAWGRLAPHVHTQIGWIYAGAAWMSLVLITGITAFMLNPGDWRGDFWRAFFNPQFAPQTLARTGAALLLTTLYVYLHASLRARPQTLHDLIARRSTLPAMIGGVLIILGGLGWLVELPASARQALAGAAALNILMVLIFFLTAVVLAMFYLGPYRHPAWLSPGAAILLFLLGLAVTGATEFVREAVRKPFVIYGEVYSHNVYPGEISHLLREGFLNGGVWTRHYIARRFPALMTSTGQINTARIPTLPIDQQIEIGHTVFNYHCASCHAPSGYSGMKELLPGWTGEMIGSLIVNLDKFHYLMPPWSGTAEESGALRRYLETLASPKPIKMKEGTP